MRGIGRPGKRRRYGPVADGRVGRYPTPGSGTVIGLAVANDDPPLAAQTTAPDFAKDVAPILYRNCASCHRDGGLGPFSMMNVDSVKAYSDDIRDAVRTGNVPPWHAEGAHGVFSNDRRLSDLDKQTILRWVDGGARIGRASCRERV